MLKSGLIILALIILTVCISGFISAEEIQKKRLTFEKAILLPIQVYCGEEVTVKMIYRIAGTGDLPVMLQGEKTLWHNGVKIRTLSNDEVERKDGLWENSLNFIVPDSAEEGEYTIEQKMILEKEVISSTSIFKVVGSRLVPHGI